MNYAFTYLSNKIEILYEGFKKALYYPGANPFAKRLIIVPSPAMKGYLKRQLAEDVGIFFGLDFAFIDEGIELLGRKSKRILSCFELSVIIENEISSLLKQESHLSLWQPLIAYLNENTERKKTLKIIWLSEELARLFLLYGEYGQKMAQSWEQDHYQDWQAELWRRIYKLTDAVPLYQVLLQPYPASYQEIHLFGLSFISDIKHQFLLKIAENVPVYSWFLSPCQKLWSDIHSDKESNAISSFWLSSKAPLQNLEDLIALLQNRNPLLGNFGKLGRHTAKMIEESLPQTHGQYEVAKPLINYPEFEALISHDFSLIDKKLALLDAVQADLALLRVPTDPIELSEDNSIQIHSSPSKLREVENVYQILLKTIHESKEPIEPHEIIVMAPEINEYAPFIHMIFGSQDSQLDYQIMDLKLLSQGELIQAFMQIIQLADSKWKLEEINKLFSYSFFAKKQGIEVLDLAELIKWLENLDISWGINNLHRTEILHKNGFKPLLELTEKGTWQEAIDSLLMGMVFNFSEENESRFAEIPLLPKEKVDLSNADLLGKFAFCLQRLKLDLEPLYQEHEKTIHEWAVYFRNLLESYLAFDFEEISFQEEYDTILKAITRFHKAGDAFPKSAFSASSAIARLKSLFDSKEFCYREKHFQAIRFSSLLPMRAVPAKVVLLMGMNDDVYPRKERKSSLDKLATYSQKNYCPTQTDYDRYLFLEALLSARQAFIISYVAKSTSSGLKSPASTVVNEFLDYLKKFYCFDTCFHHPFFAFDKQYFIKNSPFKSYSERMYQASAAYYASKKEDPPAFIKQFSIPDRISAPKEHIIEIKALSRVAKHPLQSYLNKTLGIYLNQIQENVSDFELSSLERYQMKQKALKQPLEAVLTYFDKKRSWPYAPFDTLAKEMIAEDVQKIEEALALFSLEREDLIDCEFSLCCHEACFNQNKLQLPPIEVQTSFGIVKVIGKLSSLSLQGSLIFEKKELTRAIRIYPEALLFSTIPEKFVNKHFLFADKGEKLSVFECPEKLLSDFLNYYYLAHTAISPFMPDWISAILEGSAPKLAIAMEKSVNDPFKGYQDPYIKWIFHEEALPDAANIIEQWQPMAKNLFEPLQKMWDL